MLDYVIARLMGLDVIPRDEATGEVLDPRSTSVIHLYRVVSVTICVMCDGGCCDGR